jgi:predicted nucleotidyltransferase
MRKMTGFGLEDRHWKILEKELFEPLQKAGAKIWIFGSRARGDYRPFSDIDILIESLSDRSLLGLIAEKLEESALPVRVDLVLEEDLAEGYRAQVMKERVAV